jgi:hypothetical protein
MLKKTSLFLFIAALALTFSGLTKLYSQTIPTITLSVNKKSYKPGDEGVITIKFKPAGGTKIPKEPQIEVTLTGDGVVGNGLQDYSGDPDGDYLSSNVIKYNFTVTSDAPSGDVVNAKVKIKFGYCSSESGICKIGNVTKSVKIKIK